MKGASERIARMRASSAAQDALEQMNRPNKNSQEFLRMRYYCELEVDFGAERCYDRCDHCRSISRSATP